MFPLPKSSHGSQFFNDQIFAAVIFRCDMLLLLGPLGLTFLLVGCLCHHFFFVFPPFILLSSLFLGSGHIVNLNIISCYYACSLFHG